MSGNDRPELHAFRELETLVRNLGEELAMFRRRALSAEAQLKAGDGAAPASKPQGRAGSVAGDRLTMLEAENEALRRRVERAEDRVRQVMDRVRFLRQQLQTQTQTQTPTGVGAARS
jgi:predicted  nucleic acid-binding Zn-ribbon protein